LLTIGFLPHSKPSKERVGVVAEPAAGGRLLQLLGVSSADDEVVEEKRGHESCREKRGDRPGRLCGSTHHLYPPFIFARKLFTWYYYKPVNSISRMISTPNPDLEILK
jgi:hypothetical protein